MAKIFTPLIRSIVFSIFGTVSSLYILLVAGYILLLDWVPGSYSTFPYQTFNNFFQSPSNLILFSLSTLFSGWIIQKIILISLCFSLFFVPLYFFPWKQYKYAAYFTAIFFAINPFVYERLLAGQWRVLAGYVCLFPLFYYLFQFSRDNSLRSALGVFTTLLFTGIWSIHFLAIGIVVTALYLAMHFMCQFSTRRNTNLYQGLKNICLGSLLFLLVSLYWIIPLCIYGSNQLEGFGSEDYSAFSTVRDPNIGTVLNVLTLRGFWATDEAWGEQFKHPGDTAPVFYSGFIVLLLLVGVGWCELRKDISARFERNSLLVIFVLATIFATGISAYGLWQINYLLLEHVPFWSGFRDAQKWVGVLAVVYALFAGVGIASLIDRFTRYKFTMAACSLLIALAISPYQLFGLSGQVQPVWYPTEWSEVDMILKQEENCTAVFLPWHQYYAVAWNNGQLSGNPAQRAFECTVFTSQNTELGSITISTTKTERETAIEASVTSNRTDTEAIARSIAELRTAGIKYLIVTPDIIGRDIYLYPLLGSPELTIIYTSDKINVYKIN